MKTYLKINNKGMTLVEVIVSMAIIGIIIVSFLTIFTFAFTQIAKSGNLSKAVFMSQRATDKEIAGVASPVDSTITSEQRIITIELPAAGSIQVEHEGEVLTITSDSKGRISDIWTFLP